MWSKDSIHVKYLRAYIQKYKQWPTFEDGSSFAYMIAWHDRMYADFYIPLLREAIKSGDASSVWYNNFIDFKKSNGVNLLKVLKYPKKIAIDVSCLLQDIYPGKEIAAIDKAIKEHCPIKDIYFVVYSRDKKAFNDIDILFRSRTIDEGAINKLYLHVSSTCERKTFSFEYLQSDTKKAKLIMYIFY